MSQVNFATLSNELSELVATSARSVVHVGGGRRGASGVVLEPSTVVTTARAVVATDGRVEVTLEDESVGARVAGIDAATDLAVLSLDAPLGTPLELARDAGKLGQLVLSVSRPGRGARVRLGVLSSVAGVWYTPRGARVERYLESDLSPEVGFSGSLALGVDGTAVGLHSAGLLRGAPLVLGGETVQRVATSLAGNGRVARGYLGVGTQAVRLPVSAKGERSPASGLLVVSVQPGSPAERAGLLLGDVLLRLGDAELPHVPALQAALESAVDAALPVELLRAGQLVASTVTPGVRP